MPWEVEEVLPVEESHHGAAVHWQGPGFRSGDALSAWDDGDEFVIQGWRVNDPGDVAELLRTAGQNAVAGHKTLIRVPKKLMHFFAEGSG